jgi:hypothetical protein
LNIYGIAALFLKRIYPSAPALNTFPLNDMNLKVSGVEFEPVVKFLNDRHAESNLAPIN